MGIFDDLVVDERFTPICPECKGWVGPRKTTDPDYTAVAPKHDRLDCAVLVDGHIWCEGEGQKLVWVQ
jgi:hypothetical protein